jgi:beta-N-acetylhexosaminidase
VKRPVSLLRIERNTPRRCILPHYWQAVLIVLLIVVLPGCTLLRPRAEAPVVPPPPPPPVAVILPPPVKALADVRIEDDLFPRSPWADSVLTSLDWRRTVAQLLIPFSYSDRSAKTLGRMRTAVREFGVGGVLLSRGSVSDARALIDSIESWSAVPMLISADFEHGPGMRLDSGLALPSMMAMAATRNTDLIYRAGRAVAEASSEIGVRMNFAPVADVNSNPRNPIINTRSFGEQPGLVADMAEAYMRGLQDGGMIATAKHFPGHGDTHVDSHTGLPVVDADLARLDSVELPPFRRLIDAGVMAVMSGHLAVPSLTGDSTLPATLTAAIMDTLLRRKLGFRGLVVTDAMNMRALTRTNVGNLPAAAVKAGADVLLIPGELGETIDSISAAVARGEIDSLRIRQSALRILEAKDLLGLSRAACRPDSGSTFRPDTGAGYAPVRDVMLTRASFNTAELAGHIADEAVTLLRNTNALLPLADSSRVTVVSFVRKGEPAEARAFITRMSERFPLTRAVIVERKPRKDALNALRDSLRGAGVIVFAAHISVVNASGSIGLSEEQLRILTQAGTQRVPRVLISLGTPYVLEALPTAEGLICTYGDDPASIAAAVRALAGDIYPRGKLPVSIPGVASSGDGLTYPRAVGSLANHAAFTRVDSLIQEQILRKSTPGAQLAVLRGDTLLYLKSYGHVSYDSAAAAVDDSTLYDIASLSKVVVTTTAAMQLVEDGRLQLDSTVAFYLPEFGVRGKTNIRIRNLLMHDSGLEAFRPFHMSAMPDSAVLDSAVPDSAVLDSILAAPLTYATGSKTVYSDFGMITLGKVIERISGLTLDAYASEFIFAPLAMSHSRYNPPDSLCLRCAPTEVDRVWRKRLVQGSVHDETAALLGGAAGHAGVFSTAADLSRFARMLLGGGILEGRRIVAASTLALFTTRQSTRSGRSLGWDLRSASGSSAGQYFSMRSFGHTGFTGTSIWVDPVARVAVVFLTNRVHPTRENKQLPRFRAALHDAVREALAEAD